MNSRILSHPTLPRRIESVVGVPFPVLAAPLLGDVRVLIKNGVPVTTNMQPVMNRVMRDVLRDLPFFDGLLEAVGSETSKVIKQIYSQYDFRFTVYDVILKAGLPFAQRLEHMAGWASSGPSCVRPAPYIIVTSLEQLLTHEAQWVQAGARGLCLRTPEGLHTGSAIRPGDFSYLELVRPCDATQTQQQAAGKKGAAARTQRRLLARNEPATSDI